MVDNKIMKSDWHTCKICNQKIQNLAKLYGGTNIYYTEVFVKHLIHDHEITIEQYFIDICKFLQPICPCGICNNKLKIKLRGGDFFWKKMSCGRNKGVLEWSKKAKIERLGKNNPMFGLVPWNFGLTAVTNNIVKSVADKRKGSITSEEVKKKQSEAAKKRLIHGHTGRHHSEETKEFLRQNTLRLIKEGVFKQTKTACHQKLGEILDGLHVKYEEEKQFGVFSFDYYLTDFNIYCEADGDYFHSNPQIYTSGPKTKTQKINWYRDLKKNKFCESQKIKLIRFWESNLLNNQEEIKCILKKLLQLDH